MTMIPLDTERWLESFKTGNPEVNRSMRNMCEIEWMTGGEGERNRQTTANALVKTWDGVTARWGMGDMKTYRRCLQLYCPRIIGLTPPDFAIDKGFQPTPAQILQGPAPGKTWYLRQWVLLFDFLPGVPYIPLPLLHLFVAANPSLWLSHNFTGFPGDESTERMLRG